MFRTAALVDLWRWLEVVERWPVLGDSRPRLLLLWVDQGANPRSDRLRNRFQGAGDMLQLWLCLFERAICGRSHVGSCIDRKGCQVFQRSLHLLRAALRPLAVKRGPDLRSPLSQSRGYRRDEIGGRLFEPGDIILEARRRVIVAGAW